MHTRRAIHTASSFVRIFERRYTRHHYAHQKIIVPTQAIQATTTAAGCFTGRQQQQPHG
jgi:hypothetical protein